MMKFMERSQKLFPIGLQLLKMVISLRFRTIWVIWAFTFRKSIPTNNPQNPYEVGLDMMLKETCLEEGDGLVAFKLDNLLIQKEKCEVETYI